MHSHLITAPAVSLLLTSLKDLSRALDSLEAMDPQKALFHLGMCRRALATYRSIGGAR